VKPARLHPLKKKSAFDGKSEKNVKKRAAYQKFDTDRPAKGRYSA
jgi:hypothetical protein